MIAKYHFYLLQLRKLKFHLLPYYIKIQARHDYKIFTEFLRQAEPYSGDIKGKRVLDLGCGARFPFTLLLQNLGIHVTGIDFNGLKHGLGLQKYRRIWQTSGAQGVILRLIQDIHSNRIYYRELSGLAGHPLSVHGLDLRETDAGHTAFSMEEFDLVVSNAVFEHLQDVDMVLVEMERIMKKGAIAYVAIHLFTSLTGGHNILWSNPDTQEVGTGVPTWDHLRERRYPVEPSLNRWREDEYKKSFLKHFEILEWYTQYWEPENYLTPEIASELRGYHREELLKRGIIVIARKT